MNKEKIFWAFVDKDLKVHVKRYKNDRAIENAERFPLTQFIVEPFTAKNYHEAKLKIMNAYADQIILGNKPTESLIQLK
jgi:hypothetical protein